VDVLQACGARVHLAHPLGVKGWAHRRVKNDRLDAAGLADLLRMGRLPEAWIAPPHLRQLRELVRYRAKLVALRSGLKAQVHAVLAKEGVAVPMSDLFGKAGQRLLADVRLATAYRMRVESLLELIDVYDHEVAFFTDAVATRLRRNPGYQALQLIPGVGPTFAAIFVVEIGDVTRFARPGQLACWAGLTPRHRESDTTVHRGHITKQGSRLVRWAAVEAVQRLPVDVKLRVDRDRIAARRGRSVGKVAAARRLLTHVYYGLRDAHIRALAGQHAA
jgi:transposase